MEVIVILQLREFLCKREEMGQQVIVVRGLDVTSNYIISGGKLNIVDPHGIIDHEAALYASDGFTF